LTKSEQSYERLIQPIEDQMIRSVWRIVRQPDDAEDAFQDALATIWTRLKRISRHPNPHALILRICVDAARDVLRRRLRRRRRETLTAAPDPAVDPAPSALDQMGRRQVHTEVSQAIARLSRKQAAALLMRIVQEQPYLDIARALGCSESTARIHVSRARARLRQLLPHMAPGTHSERK